MAYSEIVEFLRELDRVDNRLAGHASGLLLHSGGLGEYRELTHELRNEPRDDGSVRVTLLHRFVVGLTPDFGRSHEIDLVAAVTVGDTGCSARVAVDAHLDHAVAPLPEGRSVLWERHADAVGTGDALRFLGSAVEELCGLENPFGPLTTFSNR
ncbi:hypothetical protein [Streptomyces sp. TRM49041]|uniref:hypothetical protein n=1 Tax=Streptomyces sp. TRM49041 TaxID=2603216 RepID=UPI0011EC95DE|nr:hypothetical protein [Streptomyces sp. TRM49041]